MRQRFACERRIEQDDRRSRANYTETGGDPFDAVGCNQGNPITRPDTRTRKAARKTYDRAIEKYRTIAKEAELASAAVKAL